MTRSDQDSSRSLREGTHWPLRALRNALAERIDGEVRFDSGGGIGSGRGSGPGIGPGAGGAGVVMVAGYPDAAVTIRAVIACPESFRPGCPG